MASVSASGSDEEEKEKEKERQAKKAKGKAAALGEDTPSELDGLSDSHHPRASRVTEERSSLSSLGDDQMLEMRLKTAKYLLLKELDMDWKLQEMTDRWQAVVAENVQLKTDMEELKRKGQKNQAAAERRCKDMEKEHQDKVREMKDKLVVLESEMDAASTQTYQALKKGVRIQLNMQMQSSLNERLFKVKMDQLMLKFKKELLSGRFLSEHLLRLQRLRSEETLTQRMARENNLEDMSFGKTVKVLGQIWGKKALHSMRHIYQSLAGHLAKESS